MSKSNIEWTEETWNPVTGCTKVSPGCENCYAMGMSRRCAAMGSAKYDGVVTMEGPVRWTNVVRCHDDALGLPLQWRKPRRVFVDSMGDLFHKDVPFEFIDQVFGVMARCHLHTFQVLTKRPERAREYFQYLAGRAEETRTYLDYQHPVLAYLALVHHEKTSAWMCKPDAWPLPNVWLGTSVENQETADRRIPHLLQCSAAVRFLSCEPLLGPVDLRDIARIRRGGQTIIDSLTGRYVNAFSDGGPALPAIDWVIAGGESGGRKARPMHPDWVRSLREQCVAAGVPFYFKQWGAWIAYYDRDQDPEWRDLPHPDGPRERWLNVAGGHGFHGSRVIAIRHVGKKRAGRLLDGREWNEFPGELDAAAREAFADA